MHASSRFILPSLATETLILIRYASPIIVTHLLENSLILITMISLGRLGTKELAAGSLANITLNCTSNSFIIGFSSALDSLCSQSSSSSDQQQQQQQTSVFKPRKKTQTHQVHDQLNQHPTSSQSSSPSSLLMSQEHEIEEAGEIDENHNKIKDHDDHQDEDQEEEDEEEQDLTTIHGLRTMLILLVLLIPQTILIWKMNLFFKFMRIDEEVIELSDDYLKIYTLGIPSYTIYQISKRWLQAQRKFLIPTRILSFIAPIHLFLNLLLNDHLHQLLPIPILSHLHLGFRAVPIATVISFNLMGFLSMVYSIRTIKESSRMMMMRKNNDDEASRRERSRIGGTKRKMMMNLVKEVLSLEGIKENLRLGFSGFTIVGTEWWFWEIVGFSSSILGPIALAAQSVVATITTLMYQFSGAVSLAAAVRMGQLIGANEINLRNERRRWKTTRRTEVDGCCHSHDNHTNNDATNSHQNYNQPNLLIAAYAGLSTGFLLGTFNALIIFFLRDYLPLLFSSHVDVILIVSSVLPIVALAQIPSSIGNVLTGVIRGVGKPKISAMLNCLGYYALGLPFGLFATFSKFQLGVYGLWVGMLVAVSTTGIGCYQYVFNELIRFDESMMINERFEQREDEEGVGTPSRSQSGRFHHQIPIPPNPESVFLHYGTMID